MINKRGQSSNLSAEKIIKIVLAILVFSGLLYAVWYLFRYVSGDL